MALSDNTDLQMSDKKIMNRVKFRRKDIPGLIVRYVIAIALLAYILTHIDSVDFTRLQQLSWITIAYLIGIKAIVYVIMAVRLKSILAESEVPVSTLWVFGINKTGLLISYLTPSSVLSDVGKIFFFRRFRHNTVRIFVALFLDRLLGLLCILFVLAGAAAVLYVQNTDGFWRIFIGATLVKTAFLVGAIVAVFMLPVLFWKMSFFRAFIKKHFSFLTARLSLKIVGLSLISHLVYCFLVMECSRVTSEIKLSYTDAAIIFPMSTIATAVPTTPGAIGVGQVVYKYLVDVLTVTSTDAGVLIFTLLQLLDVPFLVWGLVSGIYLIVLNKKLKPS